MNDTQGALTPCLSQTEDGGLFHLYLGETNTKSSSLSFCMCLVTQLCPALCDFMGHSAPTRLLCLGNFGKNTEVVFFSISEYFFQGIIPMQGSNRGLLWWQADSLPWSHWEAPPVLIPLKCFNFLGEENWTMESVEVWGREDGFERPLRGTSTVCNDWGVLG